MSELYIDIMIRSLERKETVLDDIIKTNEKQHEVLRDAQGTPDDFDETVERKSALIEELEQLDTGFEKLFEHVKEEVNANHDRYAQQIREMQLHIKRITDKSVKIQAQEARNKELMIQKFSRVKEQAKQIRANSNMVSQYYKNMSKLNIVEPQFLDDKN